MKKIVSNILIVSTQLIIGGLFLFMLFSDSNENNEVVVVENDNLNKMADAVSELFVADQLENKTNDTTEVDLVSEEERKAQEQAEAEARAKAEEEARIKAEQEAAAKAQAEEEARKKAEEEARNAEQAAASVDNSVVSLQAYAKDLVINTYGWSDDDFNSLVLLWNKESGWNYRASSGSGAYGIPQALPGNKMASAGSDYLTNGRTQIRWGLGYIKSTYGSPSVAWNHFLNSGWY